MYTVESNVRENITREFRAELSERDYDDEHYAVDKIIDNALKAKANLLELLSKHPLWNAEKLMIAFDQDYDRKLELNELTVFCSYLRDNVVAYIDADFERLGIDGQENIRRRDVIFWMEINIKEQFFNESMAGNIDYINTLGDYKLRTNEKSSKAIGKICRQEGWDKLEGYGKRYAALCDNLNPIKVKRHTVVSLNPIDFLLMSNGDSWESCHYIGNYSSNAGCYSSGTISYMLDECSFIFYTVDASYDGTEIERAKKAQRQVFGYNDEVFLQSRLYPQGNDCGAEHVYTDIRNIVQKILADCLDKPNLWTISRDIDTINDVVEKGYGATCYPDWHRGNPGSTHCCLSTLKSRANGKEFRKIVFGTTPICISCGGTHNVTENISCCRSGNGYYCADCGSWVDEDDVCFVGDEAYCDSCANYCDRCGCYEHRDNGEWLGDYWYCDGCLPEVAYQCDECGCWEFHDDCYFTDYNTYCSDCGNELLFYCNECGEYHHKEDGIKLGYDWYCEDCIEKVAVQCDRCGEWICNDDAFETEDGKYYCNDCFVDVAFECCECGSLHEKSKGHYDEETDDWYCDECYEQLLEEREESEDNDNEEQAI